MATTPTSTEAATTVARYRDSAGARHRVIVRASAGGWEIIDVGSLLVDRLDAAYDERSAAEALAREYAARQRQRPPR